MPDCPRSAYIAADRHGSGNMDVVRYSADDDRRWPAIHSSAVVISIMTGSSWTTIATIGVAFIGIGTLLGYSTPWVAGAIISGAYFGDKISPLSDTTVLSSSSTGVDLFRHIRYMLITTVPTIVISMVVFAVVGFMSDTTATDSHSGMVAALRDTFHLTPWIMVIPIVTMILIVLRINTLITLLLSTLMGLAGIFIFQPHLMHMLSSATNPDDFDNLQVVMKILFSNTSLSTGDTSLDSLVSTGGVKGMLPTVWLVLSAMLFGGVMMGCGYIARITAAVTHMLRNRVSAVATTAVSGLFLNSATADQYLSIIVGANMYRDVYSRLGLEGRLLSRTLEDSVSVTSVLIPWNSCGVTQSSVLGVATLAYMPFCVFNWLSPLMSLIIAISGFRIVESPQSDAVADASASVV